MYRLYANDDNITHGTKKFIVDNDDDIKELPTSGTPGSSALVLSSFTIYILNTQQRWIKMETVFNPSVTSFLEWGIF